MTSDNLRQRRLEIIGEHFRTEVTHEFDLTLATFNGHPHYEIMATGQVFDGDDEVMGYYRTTRTAFPDQRHDNVRFHVADDAICVLGLVTTKTSRRETVAELVGARVPRKAPADALRARSCRTRPASSRSSVSSPASPSRRSSV